MSAGMRHRSVCFTELRKHRVQPGSATLQSDVFLPLSALSPLKLPKVRFKLQSKRVFHFYTDPETFSVSLNSVQVKVAECL